MMRQFRDLTLLPISETQTLVIACDSSAAIGEKKADMVSLATATMAAYSLRVPLLETLCIGASPLAVIDTVGNEMQPTGHNMIAGIKAELIKAGYPNLPINGSTEENMVTVTTSIGVTVIGMAPSSSLIGLTSPTDLIVYQLGRPFSGETLKTHNDEVFDYDVIRLLRKLPMVQDILPVGSKGILYELSEMARTNQCVSTAPLVDFESDEMHRTAGPSTVALIGVTVDQQSVFDQLISSDHAFKSIKKIAILRK
ncbi:Alpha-ribazole-5-phosphate synthase CblS for cobalamin biosynthesis [Furfurilactobacillus rossiae]|uniref:hypothetical protein n=1 Tax=Furfurilactobacillus rossiae TaxID=231049 RepID=UPI001CDB7F4B|nr:hypothetical protein [Furfurilactobacillus rossiae]MCF6165838.1 hypothetical protein [Furfurilactobacillus rossiae]QLE64402.1 Alpha-ribazole-5-phosphate synthase CblS for cobalamin biosynthesis [Furfurilactobacillus rossiae]